MVKVIPQYCIAHCEINARFLLNEHGDHILFLRNIGLHIIIFNLKKIKNFIAWKKRYTWKRTQNRYFGMQIMAAKTTTGRTLFVQVDLNGVSFLQIL